MSAPYCKELSSRTDFAGYIELLRNKTGGDFSLVKQCRAEVCGALWGSGNPDITGIGMAIGYLLETAISMILIFGSLWIDRRTKPDLKVHRLLLSNASRAFYDNAIFFTFAIQLASIITLARANFGVSADGMGAITMKIAWLVSTLTLLPLFPMVLRPQLFSEKREGSNLRSTNAGVALGASKKISDNDDHRPEAIRKARQSERLLLLVICWALSFYPFFSRMAGTFGASQIGDSTGTVISNADFEAIQNACFENIPVISSRNETTITAFGIGSWLLITIIVIYQIILSALQWGFERQWMWLEKRNLTFDSDTKWGLRIWVSLCAIILVFLVAQFWAFFRLRQFQSDMTKAAGGDFSDGQFSFGQIVAVVLFVPVIVEVLFLFKQRSLFCE